jgi:hypothetical protein
VGEAGVGRSRFWIGRQDSTVGCFSGFGLAGLIGKIGGEQGVVGGFRGELEGLDQVVGGFSGIGGAVDLG